MEVELWPFSFFVIVRFDPKWKLERNDIFCDVYLDVTIIHIMLRLNLRKVNISKKTCSDPNINENIVCID